MNPPRDPSPKAILICGLGRLGQHCAVLLKELGIPVFGLHDRETETWETEGMPELLGRFTVGDCRRHSALERAGIGSCRAVLFATSDERMNIGGALAARSLAPGIRMVIRSSQSNLNSLLHQRLGNIMAFDIEELPATALSLAAIGDETVGLLSLDGRVLRVTEKQVTPADRGLEGRELYDLNTRRRRVLHRTSPENQQPVGFHAWDPCERLGPGDVLGCVEFYEPTRRAEAAATEVRQRHTWLTWQAIRGGAVRLWTERTQTQRVSAIAAAGLIVLHATAVVLYKVQYPDVSLLDAFNVATVLIFDGYSNMFAQLKLPFPISIWMLLFSLLLTMSGALVMGMLYAFLTARVLSARIEFRRRPGRIPRGGHTVVIGLGPLGRHVTEVMRSLDRQVVCLTATEPEAGLLPAVPVITGDPRQCLAKANAATAASVMVLTDDDVANLELALMAAQSNEDCHLVVRAEDAEFGRNVRSLAPHAQAISIYALSAEVFCAAALGEKISSVLRIRQQTVLATEFQVETGDTLAGRLLCEVTYGYGLVAVLYQRSPADEPEFFPPDDIRLEPGSRLVVLSTMAGLQNAEHGIAAERAYQVRILRARSKDAAFEGARTISRVTGCDMGTAGAVTGAAPGTLALRLFRHQAERLIRELGIVGVDAEVLEAGAQA